MAPPMPLCPYAWGLAIVSTFSANSALLIGSGVYSPALGAALHISVGSPRVAKVNEAGITLGSQASAAGTRQAVSLVAGAGTNVGSKASKGTSSNTDWVVIYGTGQVAKVVRAEQIRLGEVAGIFCLVPPRERRRQATLVSQDLLKCPQEVSMPHEELGIPMDVGRVHLVEASKILKAVRCRREVARRRLLDQALDRVDEVLPVWSREVAPFVTDVRVEGACCRSHLGSLDFRRSLLRFRGGTFL